MKKISAFEYNSMIWFIIRGGYIGLTLGNLILICKQDAWISAILSIIVGLIPLFIFMHIHNYNKNLTLSELNQAIFKKIGKPLNLLLIIGAFTFSAIVFLDLVHFVYSQFLFKTNTYFIAICFIIPLIYALFKGINAISKTSLIMFYLVVFTIIFIITGLFNGLDIEKLKPYLEASTKNIIHGILIMITYNIIPLIFLLAIPKNKIENYNKKITISFYIVALLSLSNAAFLTIGVLGAPLGTLFEYPEFHLLKKLQMGDFISRLESILSLEWIIALFILLTLSMYFMTSTIKKTFKTKEKTDKIIIIIACLILILLDQTLFENSAEAVKILQGPMIIIILSLLLFPTLITYTKCLTKRLHNKNSR